MPAMTSGETWDFLMAGTRTAKVATVRADGRLVRVTPTRIVAERDIAG